MNLKRSPLAPLPKLKAELEQLAQNERNSDHAHAFPADQPVNAYARTCLALIDIVEEQDRRLALLASHNHQVEQRWTGVPLKPDGDPVDFSEVG